MTDEARRLAIYRLINEMLDAAGKERDLNSPDMEEFFNSDDDKPDKGKSDDELDDCDSNSSSDKKHGKNRSPSAPPPSEDSDEENFDTPKVAGADENTAEKDLTEPAVLINSPLPKPEEVDVHKLEALRRCVWRVDNVDLLTSILNGILNIKRG